MKLNKIKNLIQENVLALCSVDLDGNPHCIAVAEVIVLDDDTLLIGDNYIARTLDNIAHNPNIAIMITDGNDGYELVGKVDYLDSNDYPDGFGINISNDLLNQVKQYWDAQINAGFSAKGALLAKIHNIRPLA